MPPGVSNRAAFCPMTLFVQIRADDVNHIVRHAVVDQVKADLGGKLILGVFEHVERLSASRPSAS